MTTAEKLRIIHTYGQTSTRDSVIRWHKVMAVHGTYDVMPSISSALGVGRNHYETVDKLYIALSDRVWKIVGLMHEYG